MQGAARVLSEHRHHRRVQFYETDAAGIVHFSWFFRYMEEAEHALWREAGLSVAPPRSDIGWARVAASCEFHRPLRFEDEFDVLLRIAAMTAKTITYACVLTRGETTIATGSITVICVRTTPDETIRAIDVPAEIAARFEVAATRSAATGATGATSGDTPDDRADDTAADRPDGTPDGARWPTRR